MEFGVAILGRSGAGSLAKLAEDMGFSHFAIGDGPMLFGDPFVYLAECARETFSIKLGTAVVNPLTRIPPVIANAFATLQILAPGRIFVGIGAANNAMRSMGMPPASINDMENAIRVIRGLLSGERVEFSFRGRTRQIEFLDPAGGWYDISRPIPVYMSAGGPRSIDVAASLADGVMYPVGPHTGFIRVLRSAIRRSDRDPKQCRLIALVWFYLLKRGETIDDAIERGFGSGPLSGCLTNRDFMAMHEEELGKELVTDARNAARAYLDYTADPVSGHIEVWKRYMKGLDPKHRPLITRRIVQTFCICGTADECLEQVHSMEDAGVDAVLVFLSNPWRYADDIREFARAVIWRW